MLEVGDCSEDVEKYIAEEEAKLDLVLKGSKTESTVDVSKTTVFDQHTDVFYGKIKESVKLQLDAVKVSVKETSTDSDSKKLALETIASGFEKTVSEKVEETKVVVEETAVGVVSGAIAIGVVSDKKKDTDVVVVDTKKTDTVIAVVEDKIVADVKVDTKESEKVAVGIVTGSIKAEKESVSGSVEVEKDTKKTESVATAIVSEETEVAKDEADKKHSDKVKVGVAVGVAGAIIGGGLAAIDHHKKKHDEAVIVADEKKTENIDVSDVKVDVKPVIAVCPAKAEKVDEAVIGKLITKMKIIGISN
jgi:hypothetical protein